MLSFHRTASAGRRRTFRPDLERLEQRDLPAVTYHGGPVLPNVEVEAVFIGSRWRSSPDLAAQADRLGGFLSYLANSSYMDMLTRAGYGVGRGSYTGSVVDAVDLPAVIGDADVQAELQKLINAGTVPPPDGNRLYFVYVEPDVVVGALAGNSASDFLGYHDSFGPGGAAVNYAVVPTPGGPNATGEGTLFQQQTATSSHELAEAVTNPQGTAWFNDKTGDEIGDIVNGRNVYLNGYLVQKEANRHEQGMTPPGATRHPSGLLWL
jgi:hypothetical protein